MNIRFNTENEKFNELLEAYQKAKKELESYLYHEGFELSEKTDSPAVTDDSTNL